MIWPLMALFMIGACAGVALGERSWLVVGLFVGIGVIVAAVEAKGCER